MMKNYGMIFKKGYIQVANWYFICIFIIFGVNNLE